MKKLVRIIQNFFKQRRGIFKEDAILRQERFEPSEWVRDIHSQIDALRKLLPDIKLDDAYMYNVANTKPHNNLSRVVVPKIEYLARINNVQLPYDNIGPLIEHACGITQLQRDGKFTHYRKGQLGTNRIKTIDAVSKKRLNLESTTHGDVLVLDVDLGNSYAGWTTRRARSNIINTPDLLALFSVDILWILLLNPNRLQSNTDLSIDSVAEEYLSEDRGWVTTLFFYHRGGKLEFGYRWNRRAYFDSGAAIADIKRSQK